ncbi:MAG: S41 family peptidase, partial [Pseudomonadota bacterium]
DRFDTLWSDFDQNYSFFTLKAIDWDDARNRYRTQLDASSTDAELFAILSDMLLELEDPHVRLDTPLGTSSYTGWYDRFPTNFDESVVTATYLGGSAMMSPQAGMLFGRIDADIGYVRVHSLGGSGHGEDFDFILSQLGSVRGIIVDLRSNGGGNDQNGAAIAARFADTSRLYRRVRFRDGPGHDDFGPFIDSFIEPGGAQSFSGPVCVLTNRGTVSSAESLVLAFSVLPNAESFGDFTAGGSANPEQRQWSNGWSYTVSRWIEYRPDGSTFEGVGLEPDVRVDISDADAAALQDTILDAAMASLQDRIARVSVRRE